MRKFLNLLISIGTWIKKYWYIPLFLVVTLVTWLLFRRSSSPAFTQTLAEVKAIQAEADIIKLKKTLGTEQAKATVTDLYKKELAQLNEQQTKQAKALEHDPEKLAKFLVRTAGKSVTY